MSGLITHEQHQMACRVDLYKWLLEHHPNDIKQKYGSVLLRADPHVSVKEGYSGYMDFRAGEKGTSIKYLQRYLGYSYRDAVLALLGDAMYVKADGPAYREEPKIILPKEFTLPGQAGTNRNLFAYLRSRGIPADLIRELVDRKLLYQAERTNNLVFVTPELDYAEIRGSNSFADKRCKRRNNCERFEPGEHQWCVKMDQCCNYKSDPFHGCKSKHRNLFWYYIPEAGKITEAVFVCEAALDAISLYLINRGKHNIGNAAYVSIGGVGHAGAIRRLKNKHPGVVIATDNDAAGDICRAEFPDLPNIRPERKDWNDDWMALCHLKR